MVIIDQTVIRGRKILRAFNGAGFFEKTRPLTLAFPAGAVNFSVCV